MIWKIIGQSVIGTSHTETGKSCEDASVYAVHPPETLICVASDGAGSARYAELASRYVTETAIKLLTQQLDRQESLSASGILQVAEDLYAGLLAMAEEAACEPNEFSCTFLGCVLSAQRSLFFQIGDGAIVRNDGEDNYVTVWWPQNGEYTNTTSFLIDDPTLSSLKVCELEEAVAEVALFTDGLQNLVLNTESSSVHQPFFHDLFKWLRRAATAEEVELLNGKLKDYLNGTAINSRTDDDKTLILATRYSL